MYAVREECVSQEHTGKLTLAVAETFIEGETIYEAITMEIEAFDATHGSDLGEIRTREVFDDLLGLTLAMEYARLQLVEICSQPVVDE